MPELTKLIFELAHQAVALNQILIAIHISRPERQIPKSLSIVYLREIVIMMITPTTPDRSYPLQISPTWDARGIPCGFLGRAGVLDGRWVESFNLADWTGADKSEVADNWRRWRSRWAGLEPVCLNQVHGTSVISVTEPPRGDRPTADGIVTATRGLALCIFTADCAPILMADPSQGVIGALHAGWRGTLANIASEGVRAMIAKGGRVPEIRVALGPSIGLCCFEVASDLAREFAARTALRPEEWCQGGRGKAYLDLRRILSRQFLDCGIPASHISLDGPCTKCEKRRYFSRRGADGAITGLQLSFVGLQ
jgi:purine-nucleoside/S-methyl-5'-thioadenosine phosphorylase / adenosine deaminase